MRPYFLPSFKIYERPASQSSPFPCIWLMQYTNYMTIKYTGMITDNSGCTQECVHDGCPTEAREAGQYRSSSNEKKTCMATVVAQLSRCKRRRMTLRLGRRPLCAATGKYHVHLRTICALAVMKAHPEAAFLKLLGYNHHTIISDDSHACSTATGSIQAAALRTP